MKNKPRYDEVFVKGSAELFDQTPSEEHSLMMQKASVIGPVQPSVTYEEVCSVLALQEKLAELEKDNANLIEINFNLEQQLSSKTEDLEHALETCESWEERCNNLEEKLFDKDYELERLNTKLEQIATLTLL